MGCDAGRGKLAMLVVLGFVKETGATLLLANHANGPINSKSRVIMGIDLQLWKGG